MLLDFQTSTLPTIDELPLVSSEVKMIFPSASDSCLFILASFQYLYLFSEPDLCFKLMSSLLELLILNRRRETFYIFCVSQILGTI